MIKLTEAMKNSVRQQGINTHKSIPFNYTNDSQLENLMLEKTPFSAITKKIKYLGINLTQFVKSI